MKEALVELYWTKSVSDDVEDQLLDITVNGESLSTVAVDPLVESYQLWVDEKATVSVSVVASDGTNISQAAVLSFVVPDLTEPLAPVGLGYTIVEVREKVEE